MAKNKGEQRTRLQPELSPKELARLDEMCKETELSRSEVVRKALRTYEWLFWANKADAEIIVRKDGKERVLVFL